MPRELRIARLSSVDPAYRHAAAGASVKDREVAYRWVVNLKTGFREYTRESDGFVVHRERISGERLKELRAKQGPAEQEENMSTPGAEINSAETVTISAGDHRPAQSESSVAITEMPLSGKKFGTLTFLQFRKSL